MYNNFTSDIRKVGWIWSPLPWSLQYYLHTHTSLQAPLVPIHTYRVNRSIHRYTSKFDLKGSKLSIIPGEKAPRFQYSLNTQSKTTYRCTLAILLGLQYCCISDTILALIYGMF